LQQGRNTKKPPKILAHYLFLFITKILSLPAMTGKRIVFASDSEALSFSKRLRAFCGAEGSHPWVYVFNCFFLFVLITTFLYEVDFNSSL